MFIHTIPPIIDEEDYIKIPIFAFQKMYKIGKIYYSNNLIFFETV
ncbi:hypothetical protein pah_c026o171 [Parachlamydia acanthamoebae str. Hall's coccus]|nr:hypothetical protein pah_c026o171 [Parachlamydia acanthamoebae str. Hall's coccus]